MESVNSGNPAALRARLEELAKDEAFLRSLLKLEEPADVQKALSQKGVDFTGEEILQLRDALARFSENGGELSEDELEAVAGGIAPVVAFTIIYAVGALIVGGGAGILLAVLRKW